jgi:hypothetical protein
VELAALTTLRLLTPLAVLRWPLPGVLLSMFLDVIDWNFFTLKTPEDEEFYQTWDRIMDTYFWLVSLVMVRRWKDTGAISIAIAFFAFRMIGQTLFLLTQDRRYLFFSPNFFDNFLVIYLGYVLIFRRIRLIDSALDALVVFPALLIPKLIHEYFLHYLQTQPWERYNLGELLGLRGTAEYLVNYVTWGALFYLLPFLAVFLYFRYRLRNSGQGPRMRAHAVVDLHGDTRGLGGSGN